MSHISLIQVVEVPSSCSSRLSFLLFIKVVSLFYDIEKVDIQIVALLAVNSRWDCTHLTAKASPGPDRDFMDFIGTHVFRCLQGETGRSAAPTSPQLHSRQGAFAKNEPSVQFQIAAATAS